MLESSGRINHHAIDNGDVEVQPSEFPFESYSEYFPESYTNSVKSIDDYEMDHLLEVFHSEHNNYRMDVDIQMLQT